MVRDRQFLTLWLRHVLCATTACIFRTSQRPKWSETVGFSPRLCVGFLFSDSVSRVASPPPPRLLPPPLFVNLPHTIFHIQLCHTPSFIQLCHTLSFTQLCHTPSFTYNFVTRHLSHTTLSHTIFHIQLCHTPSFTYNFVKHYLSHTTLSHTIFHTQLCHTPSFTSFTYNFVRHHHSHITSTVVLRGRRSTNSHLPSFGVAGVALMALGGALGLIWSPVTPRHFAWQAWHKLTSTVVLRGRCGTNSHLPSFCVAGVAQTHIYHRLAWQAWH